MNQDKKIFLQDCCFFISIVLFVISIPFWLLVKPTWCQDVGYVLIMGSLCLGLIAIAHRLIFGRY